MSSPKRGILVVVYTKFFNTNLVRIQLMKQHMSVFQHMLNIRVFYA